ncbi:MAG TPA: hypothetical protein VN238_17550 [Solirubrobacteraceae bacterium]|nr:hypothetical protein [Solirubrobacteraceae bacterium]
MEVETPDGWRSLVDVDRGTLGPDTLMRVKMSPLGQELARRLDEAGLYATPRPHPSRRKPPPPPPRKARPRRRRR